MKTREETLVVDWELRVVKGLPRVPLPQADLSGAHTNSGIKLGASAASVVQTLGPNDLDFTIRDGRVIEIVHTSWG